MNTRTIDLTETNINIDNLLDVYVRTQMENGIDVGMKEVNVEIDNDGHVIRDKFGHHGQETKSKSCDGSCGGCGDHHEKSVKKDDSSVPWYMRGKMGLFGEDASSELDDELDAGDGKYICEYCSDIGIKKEYKSYICDTCRACESCSEYDGGDCDGCTYSMYRTGELYSKELAKNGDTSYLEEDEKEIIESIEERNFDDRVKDFDTSFTIMNYDHIYSDK